MHVRASLCRNMPVVDDRGDHVLGTVSGFFFHPDLGRLEGVFVTVSHGFTKSELFLAANDIAHWGKMIVVRDDDALGPLEERVRLAALWDESRTILGQVILSEAGQKLGRCLDVQFETTTFRLEWIFPRKLFRWARPLPANAIIEVRPDAIIVRQSELTVTETAVDAAAAAMETIASAPAA